MQHGMQYETQEDDKRLEAVIEANGGPTCY